MKVRVCGVKTFFQFLDFFSSNCNKKQKLIYLGFFSVAEGAAKFFDPLSTRYFVISWLQGGWMKKFRSQGGGGWIAGCQVENGQNTPCLWLYNSYSRSKINTNTHNNQLKNNYLATLTNNGKFFSVLSHGSTYSVLNHELAVPPGSTL